CPVHTAAAHASGHGPLPLPRLRTSATATIAMVTASHSNRMVCCQPRRRLRPAPCTSPRRGLRLPSGRRVARRLSTRISSCTGISSPEASRENVASSETSPGSEPASPLSMEFRACCSPALRLITFYPLSRRCADSHWLSRPGASRTESSRSFMFGSFARLGVRDVLGQPVGVEPLQRSAGWAASQCRARRCAGSGGSGGCVAAGPPAGDQRGVLVGGVLPGEVPRIEQVEVALGQTLVEVFGVDQWHYRVSRSVDDLH